jgi:Secretion system C-terminal sorting domain
MKKILIVPLAFLIAGYANTLQAQSTLSSSGGARIVIGAGTTVVAHNAEQDGTSTAIVNAGTLKLTGNFTQTNTATYTGSGAGLMELAGTAQQTINGDAAIDINRLTVNNTAGVQLATSDLNVATALTITTGDLDLNGRNVDLGTTGVLSEDRTNNHLVTDNTATDESIVAGGILFSGVTVGTGTTEIRGTGLYLQRAAGSDYTVSVLRRHYKGALASGGGHGIERIYAITGNPTGTNTTMRIYYATDEIVGAGNEANFVLFRWQSATGWKQANDVGSGFVNGTNSLSPRYVEATGINSFSSWTVGSSVTPLPITLLGLKGERVSGSQGLTEEVRLEWATSSEVNNKGFEVEVSNDGLAYEKIAFVEGAGNSVSVKSYALNVKNENDGYYRLRQIDFDGKYAYSPIVFVEGIETLKVYPNPNNGAFTISVGKNKLDLPARLLNAQGKEVWRGMQTEVRTTGLPTGMYFLQTTVAGKTKVTKVVIEK